MQATLVAYYGYEKPEDFVRLLVQCQRRVGKLLHGAFNSYPLEQIHGTIIGLEGVASEDRVLNSNFREKKPSPEDREMLFDEIVRIWRTLTPLAIQLGGWSRPADSRNGMGESPYDGSFFIRDGLVGAMGWPVESGGDGSVAVVRTLFQLRREFEKDANALHRWHRDPAFEDNDFFFRLGSTSLSNDHPLVQSARTEMRSVLARLAPLTLTIGARNLTAVAFTDNKLPWEQVGDNRRTINDVSPEWIRSVFLR